MLWLSHDDLLNFSLDLNILYKNSQNDLEISFQVVSIQDDFYHSHASFDICRKFVWLPQPSIVINSTFKK